MITVTGLSGDVFLFYVDLRTLQSKCLPLTATSTEHRIQIGKTESVEGNKNYYNARA